MIRTLALALLAAPLALLAPPALAQDAPGERVNQVIVYGDDPCPQSSAEEITVCARKDESERYRIPEVLRGDPQNPKNEPWTERVEAYETVGAQGIASCSPVGVGGATGCLAKLIDAAYKERREGGDTRFGQLIEAERAKRLSTIDAEAAATQARVEQLEREYDAKVARERAAEEAATQAPLPQPPGQ
ncbi:MAG: hypothetical protein LC648_00665 [Novosphingobium sp.]|nr:hypothetical protein [Novosphingobium sp.]